MKSLNTIKSIILSLAVAGAFSSCSSDFLDRKPLDRVSPENFYTNADQLASFTINYYPTVFPAHGGWNIGMGKWDDGTDNQAAPSGAFNRFTRDNWKTPAEGGLGFGSIRNVNWFIQNTEKRIAEGLISGNKEEIDHCLGEAYVIRGILYFNKLKAYGDYPIVTEPQQDIAEDLIEASKRMPRNEVARFIISDLEKAITLLKEKTPLNQRVSKKVAYQVLSNVALYEGTFEKYHKGSGRVPGDAQWPGKDKEWNKGKTFDQDGEVQFFLRKSMEAAKQVADRAPMTTENTHKMEPAPTNLSSQSWNPYYNMFSAYDLSVYPEVLLWKQYSREKNFVHIVTHYLERGSASGWTRSLVESFLMKNGLPIYASGSGYHGDRTMDIVKKDRDERLQLFMWGETNYMNNKEHDNKFYCSNFFGNTEERDVTGYRQRKYYNYDPAENPNAEMHGQAGAILFRVSEAYLNYMEACYLLNGSLDGTATDFWKKLRNRAGVSDDIQKTINATNMAYEADVNRSSYDWGAFSAGQPVDATLYSIRRERRCEFAGEGYRWNDLVRWRAMDQVKNYHIEGVNFWDGICNNPYFQEKDDKGDLKHPIKADGSAQANISSPQLSKYLRPYQIIKKNNQFYENGYTFYQGHYLSPFSYKEMVLASPTNDANNSNLYQNPGWPVEPSQPSLY